MEKESLITAMKNSISDVLETMFFLPVDYNDSVQKEELWAGEKDLILAAKLDFDGPFSGCCVFFIPKKLAVSLAADFMGTDEEAVSDDQITGTVLEITNMIAGNTFSLYDSQAVFNLDVPEQVEFSDYLKEVSDSESRLFIVIDTLEDRLAFQITLKP